MNAVQELTAHLARRPQELERQKDKGVKIIGYVPNGYMPEELVYACGAIPVGLLRGGDHEAVSLTGAYLPHFLDTFCRAQIGYRMLGEDFLYQVIDLLVVPVTDNNVRAIADSWAFYADVETFRYGVPHIKDELGHEYFAESLQRLKQKLETFTGNRISDDKLREFMDLFNQMRALLKEISLLRKSDAPPISGRDFAKLNHASYYADPSTFVGLLQSLLHELRQRKAPPAKPRILLTGSTLALGDYKVLNIVEDLGAAVVVEEFCEGMRPYWEPVTCSGDLLGSLAEAHFMKRVTPAFFRPSHERVDFLLKLIDDFRVDGVVWYQLMYRDSYDVESFYVEKILKGKGIPMLKVQSDYDMAELAPLTTRVEAFLEMLRRQK